LEDSLLERLGEADGNLLDADDLIGNLERLKQEAAEVNVGLHDTHEAHEQIERESQSFQPTVLCSGRILALLQALIYVQTLYVVAVDHYLQTVQNVWNEFKDFNDKIFSTIINRIIEILGYRFPCGIMLTDPMESRSHRIGSCSNQADAYTGSRQSTRQS
jgi:hypothetical protein